MKKLKRLAWSVLLACTLASCHSYRKVPYLQDTETVNAMEQPMQQTSTTVAPKDLLTIVVSCSTPELAAPFNLSTSDDADTADNEINSYLVDNRGYINFPVLGDLQVGGRTKPEIEALIVDKLKAYLKETPLVTVRIVNYRISVLGEVKSPGSFVVTNEKINLLEAIAMAGDLTLYGMRDNVKLIRTGQDGRREIITFDLNKAETVFSPYYQLQQNDIVYVTPNKVKAKNSGVGTATGLFVSCISMLVSVANLLYVILR